MKGATARKADTAEHRRQLKEVTDLLNEGIADLKAGRVHTREEVRRAVDDAFATREAEKARKKQG
jgi:predicted transcriptional regulator